MSRHLFVFIACVVFVAHALAEAPTSPALAAKSFVYKKAAQGPLELAVTYPPGWRETDHRPAIVFFFGGGWTNGNVKQFESQADYLAKRGMVAVRADYRVKSRQNVTPKECVEDAKSAVRWVRQNAAKLGVDPDRLVVAGGSAGGHIAACTTLTQGLDAEGEDTSVSTRANVLVLFNPVLDFRPPTLASRVGNDAALVERISPTLHVTKETPPTLLMYGSDDELLAQGQAYVDRAKQAGSRVELFTADGQKHGFFNREPWQSRTTQRVAEFLESLGYLSKVDGALPKQP